MNSPDLRTTLISIEEFSNYMPTDADINTVKNYFIYCFDYLIELADHNESIDKVAAFDRLAQAIAQNYRDKWENIAFNTIAIDELNGRDFINEEYIGSLISAGNIKDQGVIDLLSDAFGVEPGTEEEEPGTETQASYRKIEDDDIQNSVFADINSCYSFSQY